ncbi:Elongator subunit elp4 [Knufia obscura]|uniref:Elongator complex protein 4 n=1 Tax=Knufia obscura TaxID=1635080 RepID=A0ABR0S488_9EURO|nr:Elongator subunit elp4 [Knufia obscura]
MSFRKRNIGISDGSRAPQLPCSASTPPVRLPGVRPSAADGRPVTSTGSASLDGLFAGHGGLPLGTSVLLEESGTTDYAGALLRFYAAEGLMQGHHVHVVGLPEQWGRELPGLASESSKKVVEAPQDDKMKIAWRYERLGQHGADLAARDRTSVAASDAAPRQGEPQQTPFCHTFDLSKRLVHPSTAWIKFLHPDPNPAKNCFASVMSELASVMHATASDTIHRLIVPSLMSPALYPFYSSLPEQILSFQHSIRKLLATYPKRLTVVQTLPLSLYPRSAGLTKWIELLSDGVYDLTPFPHSADAEFTTSRDSNTKEEPPQGLLRVHKLPIFHELGSGMPLADTDWTFTLSRRKFTIKPFNLPPIEGDTDAQQVASKDEKPKKADMDF